MDSVFEVNTGRPAKGRNRSFPKSARIRKRREFLALSHAEIKVINRDFIALIAASENHQARIGITVSKKVGNAVQRNRIKRIIREYFRNNIHGYNIPGDCSIIAKKHVSKLTNQEIRASLSQLFYRMHTVFSSKVHG